MAVQNETDALEAIKILQNRDIFGWMDREKENVRISGVMSGGITFSTTMQQHFTTVQTAVQRGIGIPPQINP